MEAIKGCEREALTARSAFVHAAVHVHAHKAEDSIMVPPGWRQGSGGSHKDASVGTGELSAVGGVHDRRGDASDPFICSSKPNRKRFSGFFFIVFSAFWAPAPPPLAAPPGGTRGVARGISPSSVFLSSPLRLCFNPSIHPNLHLPLLSFPRHRLLALIFNPLSSLSVQPVCPSFLVCFLSSPPRPG